MRWREEWREGGREEEEKGGERGRRGKEIIAIILQSNPLQKFYLIKF
jgi:hypothetical protein